MGERTRAQIGTLNGYSTVHVYSANPKTPDGYNCFIFRRPVERSLRKLDWLPVIEATNSQVPEGIPIGGKDVRYTDGEKRALTAFVERAARSQRGRIENDDFGEFEITSTFATEVQCHAISTRREIESVSSAGEIARRMIHFAASPNEEVKKKRPVKFFEYGLAKIRLSDGLYLVMGEVGVRPNSRPYYDQRIVAKFKVDSEVTSLHGQSRIGESTFDAVYDSRFRLILQGVDLYYFQRWERAAYNAKNAKAYLSVWLQDKKSIALFTGKTSFARCGAEAFLAPFLKDREVVHLVTIGENARAEDVEDKKGKLSSHVDGIIAVGGGTAIDTAKLVRGFSGIPFMAVPTTAGTGAEATRFAVYYDGGRKCSADDLRYLPTDRLLVPEFCASASAYQKASSGFDAYAQAVESLWAKGATDESRTYARKALELMEAGEQLLGSYWAGRAIDISRTTAAHAFSYYMTSPYGVPHGEAVYMMFPYVCKANGHEEYVREVPELRTLKRFVAENGLMWDDLVDRLFANVNPARLGNNPCEVRKEHFHE